MADITAEQVAKAITEVRCRVPPKGAPITDTLGNGWQDTAPAYVTLSLIDADGWDDTLAALERWHAELVAAETLRKAPVDPLAYADSPVWDDGPMPKAPATVDDTAPERLRERREGLGLERNDSAFARLAIYEGNIAHVEECTGFNPGGVPLDCCPNTRARYAAALSAAEAERDRTDPHWRQPPLEPIRVHLTAEPTPEVVDVPQPVVKRCGDASLAWHHGEVVMVTGPTYPGQVTVPVHVALLRAMLAAIDAQQPDPQPDLGEGWRVVAGDTAFAMPFGTIRECVGCGCLVSGGPSACRRCADAPGPQPGPAPVAEPTRPEPTTGDLPEPRYKVGDWVRWMPHVAVLPPWSVEKVIWADGRWLYVSDEHGHMARDVDITTAMDPDLHETARRTIAWLRGGPMPAVPLDDLPGYGKWGETIDRHEWAAQLESLLGDAP